jgi:hypothetical protein
MLLSCFNVDAVTYIDHGNAQFAGEIGVGSVGLGRYLSPDYSLGMMYGIVPAGISEGPLIETISIRQTLRFYHWDRIDLYAGLHVFHVLGVTYKTSQNGEYPKGYYPIGSIRGLLNLGTAVSIDEKKKNAYYLEAGINDLWIQNWVNSTRAINLYDLTSLAFGFRHSF